MMDILVATFLFLGPILAIIGILTLATGLIRHGLDKNKPETGPSNYKRPIAWGLGFSVFGLLSSFLTWGMFFDGMASQMI